MSPVTSSGTGAAPLTPPPPAEWRGDTLREVRDQLIWPGLLRVPAIALSASRIGLAFFALVLLALLWELPRLWLRGPGPLEAAGERLAAVILGVLEWAGGMPRGTDPHPLARAMYDLVVGVPRALLLDHPWTSLVMLPPSLLIWCIAVGAIARSAGCDFAQGVSLPWPRAVAFALERWLSLIGGVVAPVLLIAAIGLAIAAGGAALLTWPGGDLLAALLSPVAMVLAVVATLGLAGYFLGLKLIIPAVVCEGTDAIDAIQRAYAYVMSRPLLLVLYLLIAAAAGLVALGVAALLASAATSLAVVCGSAWSGPRGAAILSQDPTLTGTARLSASIIRLVLAIPGGLVAAYALSLYASGSTVLYLLLRQANDGQDPAELWMPGMIDGTMARDPAAEAQPGEEDDG